MFPIRFIYTKCQKFTSKGGELIEVENGCGGGETRRVPVPVSVPVRVRVPGAVRQTGVQWPTDGQTQPFWNNNAAATTNCAPKEVRT